MRHSEAMISKALKNGDAILGFGPSSLNLMMADTCNSQCIMCGHDYSGCGSGQYITLDNIKTIYSNLDVKQVVDVIYGGGGEPFLNPELGIIAAYTRKVDPVIQHTVITNGIASKPELVENLIRNRVHILVSINAATSRTFRAVSGVDSFSRVIENVRYMVTKRNDIRSDVNISISMILMEKNIRELVPFVRLGRDLGVDGVKTLYVRIYPENRLIKHDGLVKIESGDSLFFSQEESDKSVRDAEHEAKRLGIDFEHEPLFCCNTTKQRDCCEPWKSLFINYNGDVYPCPASEILFKNKIDDGRYNSGNIFRQHVAEFWNNTFWQALRKTNLSAGREEIVPECSCCGNAINWLGPGARKSHILDWTEAENSTLRV
jgi:MoaA/NifB/PqqE/SkfB family radical SAM enzyme